MKLFFKATHEEKRPVKGHVRLTESGKLSNVMPHMVTKKIKDDEPEGPPRQSKPVEQPYIKIGHKDDQEKGDERQKKEEEQKQEKVGESVEESKSKESATPPKAPRRFNAAQTGEFVFRDNEGEIVGNYDTPLELPIDLVMKKPEGQIREKEDLKWVERLAEQIEMAGQITPISVIVRKAEDKENNPTGKDRFVILSGNHRYLALSKLAKKGAINPITKKPFNTIRTLVKETDEFDNMTLEIVENMFQLQMTPFEYAKSVAKLYYIRIKQGKSHEEALKESAAMCKTPQGNYLTDEQASKYISLMNLIPDLRFMVNQTDESKSIGFEEAYRLSRQPKEDQMGIFLILRDMKGKWDSKKFGDVVSQYLKEKEKGASLFGEQPPSPQQVLENIERQEAKTKAEKMVGDFSRFTEQFKKFFNIDPSFGAKEMSVRGSYGAVYKKKQQELADNLSPEWRKHALEQAKIMNYHIKALVDTLQRAETIEEDVGIDKFAEVFKTITKDMTPEEIEKFKEKNVPKGLLHVDGIEAELDKMLAATGHSDREEGGKKEEGLEKAVLSTVKPDIDSIETDNPDSVSEVWQNPTIYTKDEFVRACTKADSTFNPIVEKRGALEYHKFCVRLARNKGQKVPQRVLEEYPEFNKPVIKDDPNWREDDWYYEWRGIEPPRDKKKNEPEKKSEKNIKKAFVFWKHRWFK